jgi:hypothetical protein
MKNTLAAIIGGAVMLAGISRGELLPETITETWTRGDATSGVAGVYLTGTSIRLTNCVARVATNQVQDLTDLGINLSVGNSATSFTYAATAQNATAGTFTVSFTLPTRAQLMPTNFIYDTRQKWVDAGPVDTRVFFELTLTNAAGLKYVYTGSKILTTRTPVGE